ncbi:tetratricopeptide repeat protein [Luteolibacter marinus]|uniref:tetratricopeptide repeat protein n=1 Tax=Luteolibacter marinus TaxID=2776705 RepID=UPI0018691B3F|nr:tetratricopeptide repeat protein [Luteolibacter marinus]
MIGGGKRRLLLVGWEAADWEVLHPLMDDGRMPVLRGLVENGASGALAHHPPPFSASRWTTLATGKRPWQHQVCLPVHRTGGRAEPVGAESRGARSIWEILSGHDLRPVVVGWPASHGGGIEGSLISDRYPVPTAPPGKPWPGAPAGTYQPASLAAAFDDLRVRPEQIGADTIARYVRDWQQVDQDRDPSLAKLRLLLAADASFQTAFSRLMATETWDFASVRMPAIGAICSLFARHCLHAGDPAAKPQAVYREVLPVAYQMLDAMLGALVRSAGPAAAVVVVSAGSIRETLAAPGGEDGRAGAPGILVASGPGFGRDLLVHGARAVDVTPTLLNWFGLARGDDMEGRVLAECLESPCEIPACPSWESGPADDAVRLAEAKAGLSPEERRLFEWNLVQSMLDGGRIGDALPRIEALVRDFPENPAFIQCLFQTLLAMGRTDAAGELMELVEESLDPFAVLLCRAELAWARGEAEEARECIRGLLGFPARSSAAWHRVGLLLVALREWELLEKCARSVLGHGDDEVAWLGLAEALLRRRDLDGAAKAAQRAIGIRYCFPEAHLALARAFAAQGMIRVAVEALDRLLRISPGDELARAYRRRLLASGRDRDPGHVPAGVI